MHIIFSANCISHPLTGIGRYAAELAANLPAQPDVASLEFLRGGKRVSSAEPPAMENQARALAARLGPLRSVARQAKFWLDRMRAERLPADAILHEPNYIPSQLHGRTVITVHDLSHLRHPEWHPAERVRFLNRYLRPALERAAGIAVVSEFTRRELLDWQPGLESRVRVTPNGVDLVRYQPSAADPAALRSLGLADTPYILYVGTIEPRKRVVDVLDAWARLPSALKEGRRLVVAGKLGWLSDELLPRLSADDGVLWLRYVDEAALPALLQGAQMLVYPSSYEGFGLPVLEAMAVGTPVITTANSAMSEVGHDCVLTCQAGAVEELSDVICKLLESPELGLALSKAALLRASTYTWQACAHETVELYKTVS